MRAPAESAEAKTLLVTGGTGFVGARVASLAAAASWTVRVASRASGYRLEEPVAPSLCAGVTHLVHAAYMRDSSGDENDLNVRACKRLLDAARTAGVSRCVFVSSFAASPTSRGTYGRQKARCEQLFLDAGHAVVRLGLVLGAGGLAGALSRHLARVPIAPLIDGGRQPIQCVELDVAARAVLAAVHHEERGPWNVAEPDALPYRTLIERLAPRGRGPFFVPIPSRALRLGLRLAAQIGVPLPLSADSVNGLLELHQRDTRPSLRSLGLSG